MRVDVVRRHPGQLPDASADVEPYTDRISDARSLATPHAQSYAATGASAIAAPDDAADTDTFALADAPADADAYPSADAAARSVTAADAQPHGAAGLLLRHVRNSRLHEHH